MNARSAIETVEMRRFLRATAMSAPSLARACLAALGRARVASVLIVCLILRARKTDIVHFIRRIGGRSTDFRTRPPLHGEDHPAGKAPRRHVCRVAGPGGKTRRSASPRSPLRGREINAVGLMFRDSATLMAWSPRPLGAGLRLVAGRRARTSNDVQSIFTHRSEGIPPSRLA